jgi:hypothetical protein
MRKRQKKIIFIYHNIHPHQGENFHELSPSSRLCSKDRFWSYPIPKAATDFAIKQLHFFGWNAEKVKYVCHPVDAMDIKSMSNLTMRLKMPNMTF